MFSGFNAATSASATYTHSNVYYILTGPDNCS